MKFTLRRSTQSPILKARMSGRKGSLFVQCEAVGLWGNRILESFQKSSGLLITKPPCQVYGLGMPIRLTFQLTLAVLTQYLSSLTNVTIIRARKLQHPAFHHQNLPLNSPARFDCNGLLQNVYLSDKQFLPYLTSMRGIHHFVCALV